MRILYCNKYNFQFSGTEAYLFEAMELLRSQGHEVALFSMEDSRGDPTPYDRHFVPHIEFKQARGWAEKVRNAGHAIYSIEARRRLRGLLREFRPDVAHVRNIYHHLSPSILWELRRQRVPVLYHINDFKLLCPSYNLVAKGEACERCSSGNFSKILQTDCYPGLAARALLATEAYTHAWLGTYRKCVDILLAPSEFVRDKFCQHGWSRDKFEVLQHFQEVNSTPSPCTLRPLQVLYFGRLSAEKGVNDLVRAMRRLPQLRLVVAGSGPEEPALRALAAESSTANVSFVGQVNRADVARLIQQSFVTVLPSHAFETLGKSILESYAEARPVIASDLGSRRELVDNGRTGILYRVGDDGALADAIWFLADNLELAERMGRAGWERARDNHRREDHYRKLLGIYTKLCSPASAPKPERDISAPAVQPVLRGIAAMDSALQTAVRPALAVVTPECLAPSEPVSKLRIAFIGGRGVVGKYSGIEAYYEEVGRRLAARGHEVTVYCRNHFTPPGDSHLGMKTVRLPTIRSKHLETIIHTALSTMHVLRQHCDIVHYHALGPALFSRIPRLFGKKTVVTVQGLDWQRKKWGRIASAVLRAGEWASAALPDQTMVVSRTLQNYYREAYDVETCYIPNGGTPRARQPERRLNEWGIEPGKYILFLGRMSPEKGCHVLIEAYKQLRTDVKLVLAGPASYCDNYSRGIRDHASEHIKVLNFVSGRDLDELLTNAVLFVLPSDLEGLSLALLDAMAAGLCVVASDVPENCEAVADAGFTFRRGDSQDLAERLDFLLANPSVRAAAGKAARRRAQQFYSWDTIAGEIEQAYLELIHGRSEVPVPKKPSLGAPQTVQPRRRTG
jgi:glycosyltransferase involved in cell wall biosynthesis